MSKAKEGPLPPAGVVRVVAGGGLARQMEEGSPVKNKFRPEALGKGWPGSPCLPPFLWRSTDSLSVKLSKFITRSFHEFSLRCEGAIFFIIPLLRRKKLFKKTETVLRHNLENCDVIIFVYNSL